jgi:hypothetical protein
VRRKGQSNFKLRPGFNRTVQIKEDATGADVLSFGMNFAGAFQSDSGGQAHVKAPHQPPIL